MAHIDLLIVRCSDLFLF